MGGAFVGGAAMGGLPELSKLAWVGGEGGEDHPLLVVGATQHLQKSFLSDIFTLSNPCLLYPPGYREGRSGLQHRTGVHTAGRRNTQDGKHWLGLASPSQRRESPKEGGLL